MSEQGVHLDTAGSTGCVQDNTITSSGTDQVSTLLINMTSATHESDACMLHPAFPVSTLLSPSRNHDHDQRHVIWFVIIYTHTFTHTMNYCDCMCVQYSVHRLILSSFEPHINRLACIGRADDPAKLTQCTAAE